MFAVAPTCKPNQTKVHGVAKQEKANISCQVDANPPEVQFKWTFNNSAESIDVAAGHIARAGTSSIVSYTPMTELDYGTLLCWASNHIGQQQVPCVYHIIPAGKVSSFMSISWYWWKYESTLRNWPSICSVNVRSRRLIDGIATWRDKIVQIIHNFKKSIDKNSELFIEFQKINS